MITLRSDQHDAIARTRAAYKTNSAVILQASCGFGKSYCAAEIAKAAIAKGRRVKLTVPRLALVDQMRRSMSDIGATGVDIQMIHTAIKRPIEADFLIADEAHFHFSAAWQSRLVEFLLDGGKILGLTASPIPGMDRVYGAMIAGPSVKLLINQGHLSRYRAFGPTTPDMAGVPCRAGEYATDATEAVMSKPAITGDIVGHWIKHGRGLRTIGYAVSREHSRRLVAAFLTAGIAAEHLDGDTPDDERRAAAERFANGGTAILFNVGLFQLGYDLSSQVGRDVTIEAMIDAAPTNSVPMQTQKWGRVIRRKDRPAIIFDHAGNIGRLQLLPDSDVEWSIKSGGSRRSSSGLAVSICSSCFAAFRTSPACTECGAVRELTPREVEERDGELAEIVAVEKRREIGRTRDLDGLARLAKERGFKPGWVVHRMKARGQSVSVDQVVRAMR